MHEIFEVVLIDSSVGKENKWFDIYWFSQTPFEIAFDQGKHVVVDNHVASFHSFVESKGLNELLEKKVVLLFKLVSDGP